MVFIVALDGLDGDALLCQTVAALLGGIVERTVAKGSGDYQRNRQVAGRVIAGPGAAAARQHPNRQEHTQGKRKNFLHNCLPPHSQKGFKLPELSGCFSILYDFGFVVNPMTRNLSRPSVFSAENIA